MDIPPHLLGKYLEEAHEILGIPEPDDWEDPMYADDYHEWYSKKEDRHQKKLQMIQHWWTNYNKLYLELESLLEDKQEYYTIICECFLMGMDDIPEAQELYNILGEYNDPNIDMDEWDDIDRYYVKKRVHFSEHYLKQKAIKAIIKRDELSRDVHEMKRRILRCWHHIKHNKDVKEVIIMDLKYYANAISSNSRVNDLYKLFLENRQASPYQEISSKPKTVSIIYAPKQIVHTPIVCGDPVISTRLSTLRDQSIQSNTTNQHNLIVPETKIGIIVINVRIIIQYGIKYYFIHHNGLIFDRGKLCGTSYNKRRTLYMDSMVNFQVTSRACFLKTLYLCIPVYGYSKTLDPLHMSLLIAGFQQFVEQYYLESLVMDYQQTTVPPQPKNLGKQIHGMTTLLLYTSYA